MTIRLAQPKSEEGWRQARQLIEEYAASLNLDLSFQNFAHELEHLTSEYAPPAGAFLLAEEKGGLCRLCRRAAILRRHRRNQAPVCDPRCARARGRASPSHRHRACGQAAWIHPLASGYTAFHAGGSVLVRVPGFQADCGVSIQPCPRDCFPGIGPSMNRNPSNFGMQGTPISVVLLCWRGGGARDADGWR